MTPAEIKQARHSLGLTQYQLSDVMGVRAPTISEWETGKRSQSKTSERLLQAYLDGYRPADWLSMPTNHCRKTIPQQ